MSTRTGIAVQGRHNPMQFFLFFVRLTIEIDGKAQSGSWRDRFVPLTPGSHTVDVYFRYLFKARCCPAGTTVQVAAGQTVTLQYRTPQLMTSAGRLEVVG
ncbi:hypothetical protein OHT57_44365 [Streptomyces sp. NBC_00285]|uniref:hypothetical protein n=1 Tax=Streptomyces sp. NBC_00285 TaxID=2975700 RepID=UPI002E2BF7D2|nr:hypothetical protein [Streptomyces sp. NBC_00285]